MSLIVTVSAVSSDLPCSCVSVVCSVSLLVLNECTVAGRRVEGGRAGIETRGCVDILELIHVTDFLI